MSKQIVIAVLSSALLAGCQTAPDPYPKGPGFYETKIDSAHERVTYVVPSGMAQAKAQDALLMHAADETLAQGHTWFRITSRSNGEGGRSTGSSVSLGAGNTNFGGRTAVGLGIGTSFGFGGSTRQVLTDEIVMGDGPRPNDPTAYDAADVSKTIKARL